MDWKNILRFRLQVLFHTSACGAICSSVSYRAQVGEELPTGPLGAFSVVVLYQPACLVSISLGAYSSPLAAALRTQTCFKCDTLETKCLGKWTEVVWGCRVLVHPAWGCPTSPANIKMTSELLFFLDCVVSLQNSSHKPLLDDFLTLKQFMWPVLLGRILCLSLSFIH